MNKRFIPLFAALAVLLLASFAVAQEDADSKLQKRHRFIYVPYEELDRVLGADRYGAVIEFEEYLHILEAARRKDQLKPPAQWVIQSSRYSGVVGEEQVKFTGELAFSLLTEGYALIPLQFGAVGITSAALDGKAANITFSRGTYTLIASGEGSHTLSVTFAAPLMRERRGKSLGLRIPPSPSNTVTLKVPGKAEVSATPDIFSKTYSEKDDTTTVEIFAGAKESLLAYITAEEKKLEIEPFIAGDIESLVSLDQRTVRVQSLISVRVYRKEISSLSINLPQDWKITELACKDLLDWTEEAGAPAVRRVTLRFHEPIKTDTTVTLSIEKELPQDRTVQVPAISVSGANTERPLIQISPSREVTFEVTRMKNLNEVTVRPPAVGKITTLPAKAFEGWLEPYTLILSVTPVAPVTNSFLTTVVYVERETLGLNAFCTFEVKEGTLYSVSLTVPKEWEILSVTTSLPQNQYDWTVTAADKENIIDINLKRKYEPGAVIEVSVFGRIIPKEPFWEELSFQIPRVVPLGSNLRLGTLVFCAEDSMTLTGKDIVGLADLDLSQIQRRGIAIPATALATVLGYEVKKSDYSGTVIATMKKPRISATTVTYLAINESLFQAAALLIPRFGERPAREFQFVLPAGTGSSVDIRGDFIKEKTLSAREDGDYWKISLHREVLGEYPLYIAFDVKVDKDAKELTAPKILVPDAERQDGFIAVEAGEGIEILSAPTNLTELPVTSVPYPQALAKFYIPKRLLIHAFRYTTTDYSLKLTVEKHPLKAVLTEVIPRAIYTTAFSVDGVEQTRAIFELTSVGNQFFSFRLPEGAQLWSVLLGRDPANLEPVKPAKRGAQILVPLTAAGPPQKGKENTYFICAIYQRKSQPMKTSGTVQLSLPAAEHKIPVLQSQWQTYLPSQFRYTSFGGDMKLVTEPLHQPLILEYLWLYILGIFVVLLVIGTVRHLRFAIPSRIAFYLILAAVLLLIFAGLFFPTLGRARYKSLEAVREIEDRKAMMEREMVKQEYDETLERAIVKAPQIEEEKMVEKPVGTITESTITWGLKDGEEAKKEPQKAVDVPTAPPPAQPAGIGYSYARTKMVEELRKAKEKEKGLLSLPINLRWEGTPLTFFSLSPGGVITVDYVSQNYTFAICLLLTLIVFLIGVSFGKGTLRIKLAYFLFGLILFSLLPGVVGPQNTIYCNAALFGIISGAVFFGIAAIAKHYRRAAPALLLFLSLCLVFLSPGSLYAQEQQEAQGEEKTQVSKDSEKVKEPEIEGVIVPYDPKNLKDIVGKGRVYIPTKRYEDLLRSAGLLKEEPLAPPLPFSVNSANYTAAILSDKVDFSVQLGLELLKSETAEVFIGFPGIALQNAKLDDKDAKLRSDSSGYFLVLTETGIHTFSASFSLPVDPKRVSGSVEFAVRPVPCAQVVVKTDRPDTDIIVKSALGGQEVKQTEAGKEVIAALGAASTISISYGPKEMVATGAKIATDVRLYHYFWLSERLIMYRCDARLTVSGGERDAFQFALPDNLEIYQVSAAKEIRIWRIIRDPSGKATLEVLLYEPVKDELALTMSGAQILPQKAGDFSLPFIQATDARKETGETSVFLIKTLKANVIDSQNLTQIPSSAKTYENYETYSAYEYSSRPIKLSLKTLEREPDLRASINTQLSITKEKLFFDTAVIVTVKEAPVFNLSLSVPAQFEIEEISCPQMASKFVKKEGERSIITIHLSGPFLGATSVSVSGSRLTDGAELELTLPQVVVSGAKFVEGVILVLSVEGTALTTKKLQDLIPADVQGVSLVGREAPQTLQKRLAFTFKNPEHSGTIGVDRLKPTLTATVISAALVKDEVVSFTAVIEYRIKSAPCRRFSFSMPYYLAQKAILSVPFQRQRTLTKEGEGDSARAVWTVELQRELTDSYSLAMNWEVLRTEKTLQFPSIRATDVESASAYILLQNSSGLKVTEGEKQNLEPTTKEEIPLLGAVLAERASFLFGYRVQDIAKDYSLSFSLTKLEEEKEIEAIIDIAEITTVISDDGYSFNEATYKIQNRAKQYLQMEIPEGAQIWSAEVAGRQVKPALPPEGEGRRILLPLLKQPKGELSYNVKIFYGLKLTSKFGFSASFSPKAPKPLGVTVGQTFWTVYAPEKYEYRFDGNMDEVIESVKEVEKALSYANEAQRLVTEMERATDIQKRERIAENIARLNELAQQQMQLAQQAQQIVRTRYGRTKFVEGAETGEEFKEQYNANELRLQQAQQMMAQNVQRAQEQKALLTQMEVAQRMEQKEATVGKLIAPEAEQAANAQKFLDESAQRVRDSVEKEEKARKEVEELESALQRQLADKKLDSTSGVDAYGIGGGRAGAYGMRRGVGGLEQRARVEAKPLVIISAYGAVEHGMRAAGVMPPQIQLPKVGKTLNYKKLGTDPVLVLYSKDKEALQRIYTFLTLLALILLVAAAFVLKLSFFGGKSLPRQIAEAFLLALAAYFSTLTIYLTVLIICLSVLALILARRERPGIIPTQ
jgi:hypothetical protein